MNKAIERTRKMPPVERILHAFLRKCPESPGDVFPMLYDTARKGSVFETGGRPTHLPQHSCALNIQPV